MQKQILTANQLKAIAICAMFFDHFAAAFLSHDTEVGMALRIPGRIVAPIMCYMVAEGYHNTSDRKKYICRMLLFSIISHIPYVFCMGFTFFQATSVIWGLILGLIALTAVKNKRVNTVFKAIVVGLCCMLSITANWNYIAVLWILVFGIFYGNFRRQIIDFCIVGFFFHLKPTYMNFGLIHEGYPHWYQLGIFLAIPLLALYNGRRGRKTKFVTYFFYVFYPAHLLFLFILNQLIR